MNIPKPTEAEKYQGYQVCPCGDNVHMLQAGFEVRHIVCEKCWFSVVDKGEFFMINGAIVLERCKHDSSGFGFGK